MIRTNQFTKEIELFLQNKLSSNRIIHSRETAILAQSLCVRFHSDSDKGYCAGILHDIARELSHNDLIELARQDGKNISSWEEEHPILLHGRAGAMLIKENLSIEDTEILDAVRFHTCGRPGMGNLEGIIYVADFLEPKRTFNDAGAREEILRGELLDMMIFVTEHKFQFLYRKGRKITESAMQLFEDLKEKRKKLDS